LPLVIAGKLSKAGHCWAEYTTSSDCADGFEIDEFDFYALVDTSPDTSPETSQGAAQGHDPDAPQGTTPGPVLGAAQGASPDAAQEEDPGAAQGTAQGAAQGTVQTPDAAQGAAPDTGMAQGAAPGPARDVLCSETCSYAGDSECDDGGGRSAFSLCGLGSVRVNPNLTLIPFLFASAVSSGYLERVNP